MNRKRVILALLILSLALASPGCSDSDPVGASGSTITVSANPRNIPQPLAGIIPSTISAIVLTSSGNTQVGVEVIFTTEEGCFDFDYDPQFPFDNNCLLDGGGTIAIVLTNQNGIARAPLLTFVSTTVEAQSGSAVGTETVTVGGQQVVGDVQLISLDDIDNGVPRDTTVEFRVTVIDTNGLAVVDALVNLDIDPSSGGVPAFPFGNRTDTDGQLEFEVEVLDRFSIRALVTDVFSNTVEVLLSTP